MSSIITIGFQEARDVKIPHFEWAAAPEHYYAHTHEAAMASFKIISESVSERQALEKEILNAGHISDWSHPWDDFLLWRVDAKESAKILDGILEVQKTKKMSVVIDIASVQATIGKLQELRLLTGEQITKYHEAFAR